MDIHSVYFNNRGRVSIMKHMKHSHLFGAGAVVAAAGFLTAASAYAAVLVLNQTSVTVGVGQSVTVTSQTGALYVGSNTNSAAVGISANGTQLTVTGKQVGSATVSICSATSGIDCMNLSVTVQVGSVQSITLSQTSISLAPGAVQTITVSGGGGTYSMSGNSNASVASANLSGTTLTVSALAVGNTTITICDQSSACGTVSVAVTTSSSGGSGQAITFGIASPTLSIGQSMGISMSGGSGTGFFISSNPNPAVVQASVTGSTIYLSGASAGADAITVCASSGGCGTISVTVTGTAGTTQTTTTTGITATNSTSLLGAIQAMQSQLAQILMQIQTMATTLTQLASRVNGSTATQITTQTQTSASASASASGVYTFTEFLSVGSQDAEVTALQQRLAALGFYSGPITGYFGTLTETAVKKFQSAKGIDPTGYIGPGTRTILNGG